MSPSESTDRSSRFLSLSQIDAYGRSRRKTSEDREPNEDAMRGGCDANSMTILLQGASPMRGRPKGSSSGKAF